MRPRRRTSRHKLGHVVYVGVLIAGISAAGCASSGRPTGIATSPGSPNTGTTAIVVSGSVPASLVSTDGPITDGGVFVGSSVGALIHTIRLAGYAPCAAARCWQGRELPRDAIGIAFQANPLGCEGVDSLHITSPQPGITQVDVQGHPACARGEEGAKGRAILIAVPRTALPKAGTVTAQVNIALRPGDTFQSLGRASTPL